MYNTYYSDVLARPKERLCKIVTETVLGINYKNRYTFAILSHLECAEVFAVNSSCVPIGGSRKWCCSAVGHQNIRTSRLSAPI